MTPEAWSLLLRGAEELGLDVQPQQAAFAQLLQLLQEGQRFQNLSALKTENDIVLKHFVDSLSCLKGGYLDAPPDSEVKYRLLDLGTGAGFPTFPIALMRPQLEITPLDATQKKINFVNATAEALGLTHVQAIAGRAEAIGRQTQHRAQYDRVVARAVSSLSTVAELALPLLRVGGTLIAQKGALSESELTAGIQAVNTLGGEMREVEHFQLPILGDARSLIVISKIRATSQDYPRRDGLPAQQPLFWDNKKADNFERPKPTQKHTTKPTKHKNTSRK